MGSNAPALLEGDACYTYYDMLGIADSIAENVESRSLVLLIARNTVASIAGYVGFLRRRAIPMMVGADLPPDRLVELLRLYAPDYLWAPIGFNPKVLQTEGYLPSGFSTGQYSLQSRRSKPTQPVADADSETALLLATSGSTGDPKFVRLSYRNLESNARSIADYQSLRKSDCAVTTLPFSYSYGISIVNSHLVSGASIVLAESSILEKRFWDLFGKHAITNFGGVPYTYQMLAKLGVESLPLGNLRFASQAGGRLEPQLQRSFSEAFSRTGTEFFVMYGQTEATARMAWLPPERALEKLGSIGVAIPGGSFELQDGSGQPIEGPDQDGELVYRGDNVCLGYAWKRDDLVNGDENRGILHTGDIARRDDDGFYYITGRMRRFVKLFGNRVSLDEIESLLAADGLSSACLGTDDGLTIFVEDGDEEAARQVIRSQTRVNMQAVSIRCCTLPRKANGKIDYATLGKL